MLMLHLIPRVVSACTLSRIESVIFTSSDAYPVSSRTCSNIMEEKSCSVVVTVVVVEVVTLTSAAEVLLFFVVVVAAVVVVVVVGGDSTSLLKIHS